MDHFGIGVAVHGAIRVLMQSARGTGRTNSLVESVKTGDRIVFVDRKEADRVGRLCQERGVKVDCIVIDPMNPGKLYERGTSEGRTVFDHSWVEQYYLAEISQAQRAIEALQKQTSGFGEAHRETRRNAEQMARWRL